MSASGFRDVLRRHVATVEAKRPLKVLGILPSEAASFVEGDRPLALLAEKRDGLSLFGLAGAENDLSDLLGRPVGIILVSELHGREADELPALATPL